LFLAKAARQPTTLTRLAYAHLVSHRALPTSPSLQVLHKFGGINRLLNTAKVCNENLAFPINPEDASSMPTSNPKFWAVLGFVVGVVMATGGELKTPLDALLGGVIQALVWFGVSYLIIKRKVSKK